MNVSIYINQAMKLLCAICHFLIFLKNVSSIYPFAVTASSTWPKIYSLLIYFAEKVTVFEIELVTEFGEVFIYATKDSVFKILKRFIFLYFSLFSSSINSTASLPFSPSLVSFFSVFSDFLASFINHHANIFWWVSSAFSGPKNCLNT